MFGRASFRLENCHIARAMLLYFQIAHSNIKSFSLPTYLEAMGVCRSSDAQHQQAVRLGFELLLDEGFHLCLMLFDGEEEVELIVRTHEIVLAIVALPVFVAAEIIP